MPYGANQNNYEVFWDCLSGPLIQRSAIDNIKATKARKSKKRRSEVEVGDVHVEKEHGASSTAEDLADFVDVGYATTKALVIAKPLSMSPKDPRLTKEICDPLPKPTVDRILTSIPPSVADSLVTYGLLDSQDDLPKFLTPVLQDYVNAATAPPPLWTTTRASACEICDRDWIPLSYHHLIPKQIHAKAIKRGWHDEWMLNSVAWLCRACHSFVHRMASNEELATKYWTVERLMARDEVQAWAKWVGRASVFHDVCVFCSTRAQFASARPKPRLQRRLLQSTAATFRPPAQAAAAQIQEDYSPSYDAPPSGGPRSGRGWGNSSFSVELTPEELALRESIQTIQRRQPHSIEQDAPPIAQSESEQTQDSSFFKRSGSGNLRLRLNWNCSRCSTSNNRSRSTCSTCNKSKIVTGQIQRRCSSCGWHNSDSASRCERCNTFIVDEAQMTTIAKDWKHVRRYDPKSSSEGKAQPQESPKAHGLTRTEHARKLESERVQRLEHTKNGQFVGLKSLNTQRNARVQGAQADKKQQYIPPQVERPPISRRNGDRGTDEERTRRDSPPMAQGGQMAIRPKHHTENRRKQQGPVREPSVAERPRYSDTPLQDTSSPSVPVTPSAKLGSGWGTYSSAETTLNEVERNQRPAPQPEHETPQAQIGDSQISSTSTVKSQPEARPESNQVLGTFKAFKPARKDVSADLSWLDSITPQSRSARSDDSLGSLGRDTPPRMSNEWDTAYSDISMLEASSSRPSAKTLRRDRRREAERFAQRNPSSETEWKDRLANQTLPATSSYAPDVEAYNPAGQSSRDAGVETQKEPMKDLPRTTDKPASSQSNSIEQPPSMLELERLARQSAQDRPRRFRNASQDADSAPYARHARVASSPYAQNGGRPRSRRAEYDFDEDNYDEDREESRQRRKEQRKKEKAAQKRALPPTPVHLPEFISVGNLARILRVRVEDFATKMKGLGFEETNNDHLLDAEVAGLIAAEFNFEAIVDTATEGEDLQARPPPDDKSLLLSRPPIVTIMGHVDHGKTTLLDYLRKSSVAASEHGGITQHIGAFSVSMPGGRLITFLDTPGHAAFLSMRQRGANVTDIVILVVAADDSVKPQTIEAIKHAQAAKVPMIVAINKIDKEEKNIDRVKQDLARYGVEIEDFGGDTQVVCVSGKTGQGLDELEDAAVALADILDMRAETDGQSEGWILEATTKKAGRVATVLVRRGTIRRGDFIVAGPTWAKIRTLKNEAGVQVSEAGPGTPVEVDGWKDQPSAGDEVLQATSEQQAKSVVEFRLSKAEKEQMAADMTAVNETRRLEQEKRDAMAAAASNAETSDASAPKSPSTHTSQSTATTEPSIFTLPILLKADVSGSVEACTNAITALGTSTCHPLILRSAVGPVSESDITFAASSSAYIVNFNQSTTSAMMRLVEREGVQLVEENVIYRLSDLVKGKLEALLPVRVEVRVTGEAE
ncbi:MAG: hypothetical protein Q9222_004884, partial [Ikaeria aurantiellina]